MVGNDVDEDMAAKTVGMSVFLLTDHIINRTNKDISVYLHGDFKKLEDLLHHSVQEISLYCFKEAYS